MNRVASPTTLSSRFRTSCWRDEHRDRHENRENDSDEHRAVPIPGHVLEQLVLNTTVDAPNVSVSNATFFWYAMFIPPMMIAPLSALTAMTIRTSFALIVFTSVSLSHRGSGQIRVPRTSNAASRKRLPLSMLSGVDSPTKLSMNPAFMEIFLTKYSSSPFWE